MPTPVEITPNVYQITRGGNMFLLKTAEGELTLIDAGIPGSMKTVINAVAALGYDASALKHILITHADPDHVGSVAGIATTTGATIYAGPETTTHIQNVTQPAHLPAPIKWLTTQMVKLVQKPATVGHTFNDGDTLDIGGGIQAIHAPGHTPDNFVFYWPQEGTLFGADLFFRFGKALTLSPALMSWRKTAVDESARKILAMEPSIICPGHGDTVRAPSPVIDALRGKLG